MILRWLESVIFPIIILIYFEFGIIKANFSQKCKSSPRIVYKKSEIPLPELLGSSIYALVRPKITPKNVEERMALDYQHDALDRLIRCRLNNTRCFKFKKPKPRVDFGKFCWTSQKFEPLRAAISQLRCKAPQNPHDATVSTYWKSLLSIYNKTDLEVEISVSNFFLAQSHSSFISRPSVNWRNIISSPIHELPILINKMNIGDLLHRHVGTLDSIRPANSLFKYQDVGLGSGIGPGLGSGIGSSLALAGIETFHLANTVGIRFGGIDPLDPNFPLNPLFPYSPTNPFIHLPLTALNSPYNPDGPFYPLNPISPFSPFNPSNPFNALSPMLLLSPNDPMSPWNPTSPYFPSNPHSPYNPNFQFSPLSPIFKLESPPYGSPFSPLNGNFLINRNSPWYPLGPLCQLYFLPDSDFNSPLNPQSPFNPIIAWNPQSPLKGLSFEDFLNPLNLKAHPFNLISGEEIKRSYTVSPLDRISDSLDQDPNSNTLNHRTKKHHNKYQSILRTFPLRYQKSGFDPLMTSKSLYTDPKSAIESSETQTIPSVNPCDPKSPYFAGNAYSPYHPLHPSNPYSILNPLNALLITNPLSPYNPRSTIFAGNPDSPYNPAHPMNPFNPKSFVFTCTETGSLHPLNPRSPFYILNPRSPFNPMNPFSPYNPSHPLISGLSDSHALNPALRTSPFHSSQIGSPYNPKNYQKLNVKNELNTLHDLYIKMTSPTAPEPHLGWYNGVKEDVSLIFVASIESGSKLKDQTVSFVAPDIPHDCPPAPPAPPPPQPPYFPGYYRWDPAWPAPVYIRTSNVLSNEPIHPGQWQMIWDRLWSTKCRRDSNLAYLKSLDLPIVNE